MQKSFDKTPVIFCDRFLTTVNMANVKIYKIDFSGKIIFISTKDARC